MSERDTGEDKTDKATDRRLAEEALRFQNRMPFHEAFPDIPYAPFPGDPQVKEKED